MTFFYSDHILPFLLIVLLSFGVSLLILKTKKSHLHFTSKGHAGLEIQSMHALPTPRIGGVALLTGLILATYLSWNAEDPVFFWTLVASIPVFLAGLMEDIGIGASPGKRLLAAMAGSAIMVFLSGQTIASGVAPGLDYLLSFFVVSAVFTIFATAAVCHAFNLIDGMNGLAGSISIVSTAALGIMAVQVGDMTVAIMAGAIAASIIGVILLNFPFGKIFLGDAGAYTLGFFVAWTGVLLIARNPEIARWSVLLAVFWPFMDTTAAVLRRVVKRVPIGDPDKMHFHHVIKRMISSALPARVKSSLSNPLATLGVLPFAAVPALFAVMSSHNNGLAFLYLLLCIAIYFVIKITMVRHFRKLSRLRRRVKIAGQLAMSRTQKEAESEWDPSTS